MYLLPCLLSATKARLGAKMHLSLMGLYCSSRLGDDGLVKDGVTEKDQGIIEKVFYELYPPPYMEDIRIGRYFGRQLPRWMMSTTMEPLESLRILSMIDLACCTQLPDGLCQLPCLEFLNVSRAPAIKRVGPEFVQPYSAVTMLQWEEWNWEEEVQAMPVLEVLLIQRCKLRCLPPGLSTHARTLRKLSTYNVQRLHSLDNFAFVVELTVDNIPELTRISNLPKLQKLEINCCRKLESLQKMTALRRLMLTIQHSEKQLPLYLQTVQPSHLLLDCSPEILTSISVGKFGPEFDKFSHIEKVEAYSKDGDNVKKWYV